MWLEEDRPGCGIIVWLRTDPTTDTGHEAKLALIDGNKVGNAGDSCSCCSCVDMMFRIFRMQVVNVAPRDQQNCSKSLKIVVFGLGKATENL
jgi:hypothetical protein